MDETDKPSSEEAFDKDKDAAQGEIRSVTLAARDPNLKSSVETSKTGKSESESQKETLDAIKKGERIALIIAGIVAFATIGQWVTTSCNNSSSSAQTDKLIQAAKINACAAQKIAVASERNATAAENFSASANHINTQMGEAVNGYGVRAITPARASFCLTKIRRRNIWPTVNHCAKLPTPWTLIPVRMRAFPSITAAG